MCSVLGCKWERKPPRLRLPQAPGTWAPQQPCSRCPWGFFLASQEASGLREPPVVGPLRESWSGMGSCRGSGTLGSLPGPSASLHGCSVSPQLFWTQPGCWRGRLSGSPGGCSMGSQRDLQHPRPAPSLPWQPWASPSPRRPLETSFWQGLQPCPVLGRLRAGG